MSRILVQPVGQKRLTNVAVVRLKSHGFRFEIACYKNKVLSWRSRVEKDIDEVLQSHTVYNNVSKGVLAKSKDLIAAFGTDDQDKICLEILEKGELQVSGMEREANLSSQFRDVATIVMQKTVNPQSQRPYTISMIERFMKEAHFALDSNKSSKKQALELIKDLEKQFPIVRARMRLQLFVPMDHGPKLSSKLEEWGSLVEQSDSFNGMFRVVCQLDPGFFRDCDAFVVKEFNGKLEVMAMAVQKEGDGSMDDILDNQMSGLSFSDQKDPGILAGEKPTIHDREKMGRPTTLPSQEREARKAPLSASGSEKQRSCKTCNAEVGDMMDYREHFKSDWHKHNLKRKVKELPPLSSEEWQLDTEILDEANDLEEYSR